MMTQRTLVYLLGYGVILASAAWFAQGRGAGILIGVAAGCVAHFVAMVYLAKPPEVRSK